MTVLPVIFFSSVVVVNLVVILAYLMTTTASLPAWTKWLIGFVAGGDAVAIVSAAFYLGSLSADISSVKTSLQGMQTNFANQFNVLNAEVFQDDSSLKTQVALIKAELDYMQPRVIREEFDREVARLKQELADLPQQNQELQDQVAKLRDELAQLRQQNQALQEQLDTLRATIADGGPGDRPPQE